MNHFDDVSAPTISGFFKDAVGPDPALSKRKTPPPFSLRLSWEERAQLEEEARCMPLGAYIRERLFNGSSPPPRRRKNRPVKDQQALAKVLGELGRSQLSSNLNQLAKATHTGALPVAKEIEAELLGACETVRAIRNDLMSALGLRGEDAP
ncbi:TPA: hypothetical protein ACSQFP_000965 [Pseudomonas aeruginosa]|uniref:hypothetical protein n=1 Tax=Pseudomonas TaxID=286 RepID=UPI0003B97365|nr:MULTISPECIES: hypothetical protein [Pseudomonas]EIW4145333.1 hypothetical protein [Pseudomonas aeruginosa]EKU5856896.1 hypothetical protein [Pseudomonas aeruginosa]EMB0804809.1 hypothetical protein [Pseudomonas aeruginosa]ERY00010.1 hypothetical protein Q079_00302 [Pseudomonas aeruginosa BL25]ETD45510.1 hypothetical protein X778_32295 [Pseudomonas aeruginosa VRFPA07]